MSEDVFQLIVVWTLFLTTIAQSAVHGKTWWALRPQAKEDRLATTLLQREGALAMKGFARATFEFVLVWLVARDRMPFNETAREIIYVVTAALAIYAVWRGYRFIVALRAENWGRPVETKDARDLRQQETQDKLDETALVLAETSRINATRGRHISLKGMELDKRVIRLSHRQRAHDKEGADQAAVGVLQDATDVRQGEREDALDLRDKEE